MNIELLVQCVTYALMMGGALAFLVSLITQVIKEMPMLKRIQTNVVALAVSMIICPISVVIACQYFNLICSVIRKTDKIF